MHLYTPIILAKVGEIGALSELNHLEKVGMIPLIQALPEPGKPKKEQKGNRRPINYVDNRIKPLLKNWSFFDNRVYLDLHYLGSTITPLHQEFYNKLTNNGVVVIPVINADDDKPYFTFIRERSKFGICLRITSHNMDAGNINERLKSLDSSIGLSNIDLILDFGQISENQEISYYNSFVYIVSQLENKESLRKIIFAAGSYPSTGDKFSKHNTYALDRTEWAIWKRIKANFKESINLVYGDYGCLSPTFDPLAEGHEGACSIKYTTEDQFILFRGERSSDSPIGTQQYKEQSVELISKPYYEGPDFSWGDAYVYECSSASSKFGNATIWVKVSQNHHFTKLVQLLSQQNERVSTLGAV